MRKLLWMYFNFLIFNIFLFQLFHRFLKIIGANYTIQIYPFYLLQLYFMPHYAYTSFIQTTSPFYQDSQNQQDQQIGSYSKGDEAKLLQKDLRQRVQKPFSSHPFKSIGKIISKVYNKKHNLTFDMFGTGCIIGQRLILTCAHNLFHQGVQADQTYFYPQVEDQKFKNKGLKVVKYVINKEYLNDKNKQNQKYDIALLQLEQNSIIQQSNFLTLNFDYNYLRFPDYVINISGYPFNNKFDDSMLFEQGKAIKQQKQFLFYKLTTQSGNSGGPVLLKEGQGRYTIIGVHKGTKHFHNYCILLKVMRQNLQLWSQLFNKYGVGNKQKQAFNLTFQKYHSLQDQNEYLSKLLQTKLEQIDKLSSKLKQYEKNSQRQIKNLKTQIEKMFVTQRTIKQRVNDLQDVLVRSTNFKTPQLIQNRINQIKTQRQRELHQQQIQALQLPNLFLQPLLKLQSYQMQIRQYYQRNTQQMINSYKSFYQVKLSKDNFQLKLDNIQFSMEEFIKYKWNNVQCISFQSCKIDDQKWKLFAQNGHLFQSLKVLWIHGNNITNVKQSQLQKFQQIQFIFFVSKGLQNPLSQKSYKQIKKYKKSHQNVKIFYKSSKNQKKNKDQVN